MKMRKYSILLVENEKNLVECLDLLLTIEGHFVTTAENGEEALKILKEVYGRGKKFDLMITDIWMPQMSGLELVNKLNQNNINVKVLGTSGYVDNETIAKLAEKGCTDLIFKPYTTEKLFKKIEEIMSV